jgi:hypothetical protein
MPNSGISGNFMIVSKITSADAECRQKGSGVAWKRRYVRIIL